MKRCYLLVMLVIIMSLLTSTTAFAGSTAPKIKVTVNDTSVKYDVSPYVKGGEVMVPVKQTSEALGAKVTWDKKNKTVWVDLGMMHIEVPVGKSVIYIHRDADFTGIPETVKLSGAVTRVRNRVCVPGISFYKGIGMTVTWNKGKGILSINNPSSGDMTEVPYEEITYDDIKDNAALKSWFDENNQKQGISYIKDGKFVYALLGAGEKPTGGYAVKIDSVSYSSSDTVTINAKVTPPGDNVRVMMVITYPYTLIRINSDTIKTVVGDIVDTSNSGKEQWVTMDSSTVTKMELFNLDQVKLRDITGTEMEDVMKSFNEATLDQNPYIEMIAGNILKVTLNDGYVLTFTSYGSETNVIVNFAKDGETRTFHLIAPVIAKLLLAK